MGCAQGRLDSPRSETSGTSGGVAPQDGGASADPAFLAEVHRRRLAENNPGAAYKDQQDALGRYEAACEYHNVSKPFDYRSYDAAKLRAETARIKGAPPV